MKRWIVILFLLLAPAVRAAVSFGNIVFRGTNETMYLTSGTQDILTNTGSISTGQRVVISVVHEGASADVVTGIVGANGETATLRGAPVTTSTVHNGEHWDYVATGNSGSGAHITVNYATTDFTCRNYVAYTVNGTAASQPDVTVIHTTSGGTTSVNNTLTSVTDGCFVASTVVWQADNTYTPGGTAVGTWVWAHGGSVGLGMLPVYTIKTPAGSVGPGGTMGPVEGVIVIIVAYKPAVTATYYADYVSGSDGNAGTSTGAAFKHCPGDTNATSTASSTTLAPGDMVIFKGGVSYTGCVRPRVSGTSSLPIIYDGNTAGTFGTGIAKVDLAATYYAFIQGKPAMDYITVRGFDIFGAKNNNADQNQSVNRNGTDTTGINYLGNGDSIDSQGVIYNYQGKGWWISDNYIHDNENAYDRGILNAEGDGDSLSPIAVPCWKAGISLYSTASDCVISNNVMWATGHIGISMGIGVSNVLSINNNIGGTTSAGATTNKGWFAEAYQLFGLAQQITIRGDTWHDGWQYGGDESQQRSHANDWCHVFGDNDGTLEANADPHDILIDRCFLYSDHTFAFANGTSYFFLESDWYNLEVRNCLIVNSFSGGIETRDGSNMVVNASTFIELNGQQALRLKSGSFLAGTKAVKLRNNAFYSTSANTVGPSNGTSDPYSGDMIDSDYNAYYNPNIAGTIAWHWNSVNYTLAAWRTFSSQDAHSIYGTLSLVSIPVNGSTSSSGDYHPNSSTPSALIGAGVDQSSLFTVFYDGSSRSAPWTIGALPGAAGGGGGGGGGATASTSLTGNILARGGVIFR